MGFNSGFKGLMMCTDIQKQLKYTITVIRLHTFTLCFIQVSKGKDKAIPLQAWTGPEGSRRLRLPDFKTIVT
jgi:hypothetical protein